MSNWNHLSVLSEIIVKSFRSVVLCFFLRLLRRKSEVALQDCLRPGDLRGYEIVLQILVVEIEIDNWSKQVCIFANARFLKRSLTVRILRTVSWLFSALSVLSYFCLFLWIICLEQVSSVISTSIISPCSSRSNHSSLSLLFCQVIL